MKQVLLRTPKTRGFKSLRPKNQVVNVTIINQNFKDKDTIDPRTLLNKKLIDNLKAGVKILGPGSLKLKSLKFYDIKMSATIREQAEKLGGKVRIAVRKKKK